MPSSDLPLLLYLAVLAAPAATLIALVVDLTFNRKVRAMVVRQGEAQALVTNWTAVEKALGAAGEWDHIEAQRLRFQEELGQDVDSAHWIRKCSVGLSPRPLPK